MEKIAAYVDGSCIDERVGFGAVLLHNGEVVAELYGPVPPDFVAGTRQVAGELFAVGRVLQWCKKYQVPAVELFYDYEGIRSWATGAWKAKQDLTQRYSRFVRESGIRITYHKVKAHTGNKWNEHADYLAKLGAQTADFASPVPGEQVASATQAGAAAGTAPPTVKELERLIPQLERHLEAAGQPVRFVGIFNNQYARWQILDANEQPAGLLDFYHTTKKPFNPYLHGFKDTQLQYRTAQRISEFVELKVKS